MPIEILLLSIARAIVEVAGLFLLGQGILWIFGPRARDGNFVYDLFKKGTGPIIKVTRAITPRIVHDAHIGFVAFILLVWLWMGLAFVKRYLCSLYQISCA
jgi:ABC-type phosphate transport system permease subunit